MFTLKFFRRDRVSLLLSAVLVGTLFVPVVQMSVPALREQASAITAGALLNLDASNASSYSGSGTNWYDLSGNGRHATLMNSPTYDATNKAISWGNGPTRNNSPTSDYTEVVFASMDMVDLTSGLQVISSGGSNYLQLTVPSGVTTGAITVNSPKGMAVGPTLTITP